MKILFDQNVPRVLRRHLLAHDVSTAIKMGWDKFENGDLLRAGESDGFEVFITGDKKLRYQRNLKLRTIAIVELTTNNWPSVEPRIQRYWRQ